MAHEPRLPKAVLYQAAASEALLKQQRIDMGLEQAEPAAAADAGAGAAAEPDPAAAAAGADPGAGADAAALEPTDLPASPPTGGNDLAAQVASLTAELEKVKHSYSVLQGMQRTNEANYRTQIEDLEDTVARLTTKLAQRGGGGGDPGAAPLTPSTPAASPTDAEDAETVGPEALAVIKRVAEAQAKALVAPIQQEQQQRQAESAASETQSAFQAFVSAVPNYVAIEKHANWRAHLDSPHPLTGHPIGLHFVDARDRNDWQTCANVYKDFASKNGLAVGGAAPVAKPPVKTLEQRVAPSGASAAAKPITPASTKKLYTASEVTKLYTDIAVKKPRARGKDLEDLIALERELDLAGKEGRVRTG